MTPDLPSKKTYSVKKLQPQGVSNNRFLLPTEWENAIVLNDFERPWENTLEKGTEFKALYDSKNLYLKYDVIDDHILTSPTSKDKQEVAKGDRVEIFFSCDSDLKKYYCLEVAPNGGVLDYLASHYRKFDMNWYWPQEHFYIKVNLGKMAYCVELTLSLQSLQELGVLKEGILRAGIFRADCFSLGAESNEDPIIEWVTWIDPETVQPDFHVPTAFGTLILE
ncbi:Carbohydrate family 9 binding domain-like [Flagellimonas pacifica]|uniref:Carbohydrate family 9 binding domain-like n=1 Tax=Flagellimonas pacifica TaxID=1247520 RepID=A0A285MSJ8_9FLAO|nr:Carbohydrate family 9 binding domain-like [Allomuricauda parva]